MIWLLIAFIGIPLIEIGLFIEIGGQIGLAATILAVIVTAILGSVLLRAQGLSVIRSISASMDQGAFPAESLRDGAMLIAAAALLLTPGFLTDAIGFSLFLPPVRAALGSLLFKLFAARMHVHVHQGPAREEPFERDPGVIEGEAREVQHDDKDHDRK